MTFSTARGIVSFSGGPPPLNLLLTDALGKGLAGTGPRRAWGLLAGEGARQCALEGGPVEGVEIDYGLLKQALRDVLGEEGLLGDAPMATRFQRGVVIIKPEDASLQPKEVPIEDLFRKIVRVRDQLRILEQKLNNHPKLEADEKQQLQGYLTRCYGTLTTFNVLFREKGDHFVGQRGK